MTYSAANGTATGCEVSASSPYTLSAAGAGTCLVTATKAGDATYAPTTSPTATVTFVSCTQTFTGPRIGNVTVAAGQALCFENAVIYGAVRVLDGGSITMRGSRVTQGFVATNAGRVLLCGTTVGDDLSIGSTASVVFGNRTGCERNVVVGLATFTANRDLRMFRNLIGGGLYVKDGVGPSTIAGNVIAGRLSCSGNVPAPVNGGLANVALSRSGQCAAASF